jgi:hypothetical protein
MYAETYPLVKGGRRLLFGRAVHGQVVRWFRVWLYGYENWLLSICQFVRLCICSVHQDCVELTIVFQSIKLHIQLFHKTNGLFVSPTGQAIV